MSIFQQPWVVALLDRRERDNKNLVMLSGRVQEVTQEQYDSAKAALVDRLPVMLLGYELKVKAPK